MGSSERTHADAEVFESAVSALGLLALAWSAFQLARDPSDFRWLLLGALALLAGAAGITVSRAPASIPIAQVFVFTAVLMYGPAAGTVVAALEGAVAAISIARRGEARRAICSLALPALSLACSSRIFFLVAGVGPPVQARPDLSAIVPALACFGFAQFAIDGWLRTFHAARSTDRKVMDVWRSDWVWLGLTNLVGLTAATLLVLRSGRIDAGYVGVAAPFVAILYFTLKTSVARAEEAGDRADRVSRMYLSAVETMAMAIDAKDQVTHGHIRRVQSLAIGMATRLGVRDPDTIKAIETAAVLHDLGKLAVPESILNKPGKLTEEEFERMKLHPTIGADILQAVDFPYPVVPIVRHHHEHWDGSGYPDGLRGLDIPIGARIFAVVDCFDAMTSDRPFRQRGPDEEAIELLRDRRGTTYDPQIVDLFIESYRDLLAESPAGASSTALKEIGAAAQPGRSRLTVVMAGSSPEAPDEARLLDDEVRMLDELERAISTVERMAETGDAIAAVLGEFLPVDVSIFFLYDPATDQIEAAHAVGDGSLLIKELRIPVGERLSGWVASTQQTVISSDPTLDLGEVAGLLVPRLRGCLSTPLLFHDSLVGVLTLYTRADHGFSAEHQLLIEVAAPVVAQALYAASDIPDDEEAIDDSDTPAELPGYDQFQEAVEASAGDDSPRIVLFVDVVSMEQTIAEHGAAAGEELLRQVTDRARAGLRDSDRLFRTGSDGCAALLAGTDRDAARIVASRIKLIIQDSPVTLADNLAVPVDIEVSCLSEPQTGHDLRQSFAGARWSARELRRRARELGKAHPDLRGLGWRQMTPAEATTDVAPAVEGAAAEDTPLAVTLSEALERVEREMIVRALREHGKPAAAARALGISRNGLISKRRRLKI